MFIISLPALMRTTAWLILVSYSLMSIPALAVNEPTSEVLPSKALIQQLNIYQQKLVKTPQNHAIIYNLAVLHFQLKNYSQSNKLFKQLLKFDAYHLLAKYNLGLVANRQGQQQVAIQWFKKINAHSHDFQQADTAVSNKLKMLAKQQLAKLQPNLHKQDKAANTKLVNTYLFLKVGFDDYVTDPNAPTQMTANSGDTFTNLYALANIDLSRWRENSALRLSYYVKSYSDFDSYDYSLISTDWTQKIKQQSWLHHLRLGFAQSEYGALDYQAASKLEWQSAYQYKSANQFTLRWRYEDLNSRHALFDDYAGWRQQLDLSYRYNQQAHRYTFLVGFERNDRADNINQTTGAVSYSYSAAKEKIEAAWRYRINAQWLTTLKQSYKQATYNDENTDDGGIRRVETLVLTSVVAKYRINKAWSWLIDYRYTENRSNLLRYGYHRNIVSTGVSALF